jgi:hypothetical protein
VVDVVRHPTILDALSTTARQIPAKRVWVQVLL